MLILLIVFVALCGLVLIFGGCLAAKDEEYAGGVAVVVGLVFFGMALACFYDVAYENGILREAAHQHTTGESLAVLEEREDGSSRWVIKEN